MIYLMLVPNKNSLTIYRERNKEIDRKTIFNAHKPV